jgi:hypothetical protein
MLPSILHGCEFDTISSFSIKNFVPDIFDQTSSTNTSADTSLASVRTMITINIQRTHNNVSALAAMGYSRIFAPICLLSTVVNRLIDLSEQNDKLLLPIYLEKSISNPISVIYIILYAGYATKNK